jgi:propanol-preferring alcohol dehydrogenase
MLPDTMRAWRQIEWGSAAQHVEVPVPRPVGEEVLLRVDAVGLCHSDLHLMDARPGELPFEPPFTLGHEIVGTPVAHGAAAHPVTGTVAVHGIWGCGTCRQCRRGRENYCPRLGASIGAGIGRDGGLADYVLVPSARHLVPCGDADPVATAPLTDAALTAYHALAPHRGNLDGAVVAVLGIGGLGHLALQFLSGAGAELVVAVDPRPESRQLALRLGADVVLASADDAAKVLAQSDGADLVLDFVGAPDTVGAVPRLLAAGGSAVVVGSAGGELSVSKNGGLPRGWGVRAPFWGTHQDLTEVIGLASAGRLHAETETYSMDEAMVAYDRLRAGSIRGRAVVVPHRPDWWDNRRRTNRDATVGA